MLQVYFSPHALRSREARFFRCFDPVRFSHLPGTFHPDPALLDRLVDAQQLAGCLERDQLMPASRRLRCLEVLAGCPPEIRVALRHTRISFDAVAVYEGKTCYWEFHEEQHRELTNNRPKKVFTPEGEPVIVPRYFQRLVRDVWRVKYVRPLAVVWFDWFADRMEDYTPKLLDGYQEFHLPGQFSFRSFLGMD